MCFSNFHNRLSTMQIFLSFGVYYDDRNPSNPEKEKEREELDKDLNNTLSVIEVNVFASFDQLVSVDNMPPRSSLNFDSLLWDVDMNLFVIYSRPVVFAFLNLVLASLHSEISILKMSFPPQGSTHKVKNFVFHMFRYYSFARMKRSSDYYLLRSNSKYMTWWSVALSLLIVTSGYLQLRFLKSLFVSRSEDTKPCWLQLYSMSFLQRFADDFCSKIKS